MRAHARIRIRCERVQCQHMRCEHIRSASHANAFLMRHASIRIRYLGVFRVRYAMRMQCEHIRITCARIRVACARIACECAHLRGTYACPVLYPPTKWWWMPPWLNKSNVTPLFCIAASQQYLRNIAIQPTLGCYKLWANIHCLGCSPLGENWCERELSES